MRKTEIESWALRVIQAVESKQPDEDSSVELKSKWPDDYERTARQLAGHCNAARGEYVLWLIGVDQKKGVTGADHTELANWFPQVDSQFHGLPPRRVDVNMSYKGQAVVALLFETDNAPFVVKNPSYNKPGGGPVEYEVPWRENTTTRSATRSDLLQMLTPLQKLPNVEVLDALFQPARGRVFSNTGWLLAVTVYVTPRDSSTVTIPLHRCEAFIQFIGVGAKTQFERVEFHQQGSLNPSQLVFNGSGNGRIKATNNGFPFVPKGDEVVKIELRLAPDGAAKAISVPISLVPIVNQGAWRFPPEVPKV